MKKIFIIVVYSLLSLFFLASCSSNSSSDGVLTPKEFNAFMEKNRDYILLDVRTPQEYEGGHIGSAKNINFNDASFAEMVKDLPKDLPILVYCQGGSRSAGAVVKMKELGFVNLYELKGGMVAWNSNNEPNPEKSLKGEGMQLADFEKLLETDQTVLVDFYAEWCAPCQKMKPFLAEIVAERSDVKLVKIDVDKHKQLAAIFRIESLPTLMIYKDKTKVWHHLGYMDKTSLLEQLSY